MHLHGKYVVKGDRKCMILDSLLYIVCSLKAIFELFPCVAFFPLVVLLSIIMNKIKLFPLLNENFKYLRTSFRLFDCLRTRRLLCFFGL